MTTMAIKEIKGVFTRAELELIIAIGQASPQKPNRVTPGDDPYFRNCMVAWFELNDFTRWVFDKLLPIMSAESISRVEVLQYVVYREGMYCGWHQDRSSSDDHSQDRISTAILQLSDPDEFDGGELEILLKDSSSPDLDDFETYPVPKAKGSIIYFTGDVCHRVTRVTRGSRKALVCWGLK